MKALRFRSFRRVDPDRIGWTYFVAAVASDASAIIDGDSSVISVTDKRQSLSRADADAAAASDASRHVEQRLRLFLLMSELEDSGEQGKNQRGEQVARRLLLDPLVVLHDEVVRIKHRI